MCALSKNYPNSWTNSVLFSSVGNDSCNYWTVKLLHWLCRRIRWPMHMNCLTFNMNRHLRWQGRKHLIPSSCKSCEKIQKKRDPKLRRMHFGSSYCIRGFLWIETRTNNLSCICSCFNQYYGPKIAAPGILS